MGFASILRQNIALIDQLTGGDDNLQDAVMIYAWIGSGTYGEPLYAPPVPQKAIVDERTYERTLPSGKEITQRASITIPRPIKPNGAKDRREPVDTRDKIVLPSGYTGPILDINGVNDSKTHAPFMFEIVLG